MVLKDWLGNPKNAVIISSGSQQPSISPSGVGQQPPVMFRATHFEYLAATGL